MNDLVFSEMNKKFRQPGRQHTVQALLFMLIILLLATYSDEALAVVDVTL